MKTCGGPFSCLIFLRSHPQRFSVDQKWHDDDFLSLPVCLTAIYGPSVLHSMAYIIDFLDHRHLIRSLEARNWAVNGYLWRRAESESGRLEAQTKFDWRKLRITSEGTLDFLMDWQNERAFALISYRKGEKKSNSNWTPMCPQTLPVKTLLRVLCKPTEIRHYVQSLQRSSKRSDDALIYQSQELIISRLTSLWLTKIVSALACDPAKDLHLALFS